MAAHPFRYLGAFKYDSALSTGTNTHADNSAVNFNLYIAPDGANLDPESGGMDVWDAAMPPDVDMRVYNGNETAAREFLARSKARITMIRTARTGRSCSNPTCFTKPATANSRKVI